MDSGSDRQMYSLYSYRTRDGRVPGHLVVQKLRQWPPDTGVGSLAVQVDNEAVAALGLDLLERVGFAGLSSVQIKRHADNGTYSIIEVNAGRRRSTCRSPSCVASRCK
jgi:predicted ATP-grasp superfamily ATP-dependent carboligase